MHKKRSNLFDLRPSDHNGRVSRLASDVLRQLRPEAPLIDDVGSERAFRLLWNVILSRQTYDAPALVHQFEDIGVDAEKLVDVYVPWVARALGKAWAEDRLSFARVSLGAARLQGIVSTIGHEFFVHIGDEGGQNLSALIISPIGEDHTIGPVVLASMLRRMDVSTHLSLGVALDDLCEKAKGASFDGVLISLARREALENVPEIVTSLRSCLDPGVPVVLGGSILDRMIDLESHYLVDMVTSDLKMVLKLLASTRRQSNDGVSSSPLRRVMEFGQSRSSV